VRGIIRSFGFGTDSAHMASFVLCCRLAPLKANADMIRSHGHFAAYGARRERVTEAITSIRTISASRRLAFLVDDVHQLRQ